VSAMAAPLRAAWDHRFVGPALRAALVYVLVVEIAMQLAFGQLALPLLPEIGPRNAPIPRGVFLSGAMLGTLYSFVAIGLILVYRANRIINFAQAQLGAVPAILALLLMTRQGMSYWLAIPIVLVGGALLGGLVEVVFVRRFQDASRIILTVATIGIGFVLLVGEYFTKVWIAGELAIVDTVPTPFQGFTFSLGVARFFGDHLVIVVVAVAVVVALGAFFRLTSVGMAVRAAAENRALASLLGIPVKRVSTVVWILAGVLSAIAVFLRAPLVGLPLTGFVGPTFLLFGLAAAVIARMEHLPTALLAGMLIGIIDNAVVFATRRSALATAAMLVVILVALLLQRRGLGQATRTEASSWEAVRTLSPVPMQLRGLPEVVWGRRVVGAGVLAFAVAVPWIVGDALVGFAALAVIYAIVGVSLVILTGWNGQISLGQFALAGIGAAVAGGLAANGNVDFFLALALGGIAGALVAVLVGLPALRIQGLFLAVTTLAFAFAVQNFFLREEFFGWLLPRDLAFVDRPRLYQRIDLGAESTVLGVTLTADAKFYFVALVFLTLSIGMARSMRRHRSGRVLVGVRDNPKFLQAFGVNPAAARLAAFAISGFIAALGGALFAFHQGSVDAAAFTPERSIEIFVMTVIGGIGAISGAILGAVFVLGLPLLPGLRDVPLIEILGSGLGVLLILYFLPGGLAEAVQRVRDAALRRIAARRGIVVPSLVADLRVEDDAEADVIAGVTSREWTLDDAPATAGASNGEPQPATSGGGEA
jgi:branched-chain amino acid transport system permease protein